MLRSYFKVMQRRYFDCILYTLFVFPFQSVHFHLQHSGNDDKYLHTGLVTQWHCHSMINPVSTGFKPVFQWQHWFACQSARQKKQYAKSRQGPEHYDIGLCTRAWVRNFGLGTGDWDGLSRHSALMIETSCLGTDVLALVHELGISDLTFSCKALCFWVRPIFQELAVLAVLSFIFVSSV